MTNGKRNKSAGSGWERELAQEFRKIGFPDVITTRQGSRELDAKKIDLMNSNLSKNGRLEYNVQAKNVKGHLAYGKILDELPKEDSIINVVLHKQTTKVKNRFVCKDKFAILYLKDFLELIKKLKQYEQQPVGRKVVQSVTTGASGTLFPSPEGEIEV